MIKLEMFTELWPREHTGVYDMEELISEQCPNPKCENFGKNFRYPKKWVTSSVSTPVCPKCRVTLTGGKMACESGSRVAYHLAEEEE